MRFYLIFNFLRFGVVNKRTMNLLKDSEDFGFSGGIEKYKHALNNSSSSWDNSYCVRLVLVLLDMNLSRLHSFFLNNCRQLRVYPKFLIFKLPNVSNKNALSICKRIFRSTINKRNKELHHVSKELCQYETFSSKQLSTIESYIIKRFITKKSLQKSLNTHQENLS